MGARAWLDFSHPLTPEMISMCLLIVFVFAMLHFGRSGYTCCNRNGQCSSSMWLSHMSMVSALHILRGDVQHGRLLARVSCSPAASMEAD